VHAAAGENRASEYDGALEIDGEPRRFHSVRDAERCGAFLVPQELNVPAELRVSEFLYLNREPQRWGLVDLRKLWADAAHWLNVFRQNVSPTARMDELTTHEQQLVSIARSMSQGVKVLILDEPTARRCCAITTWWRKRAEPA
jgi:ABC-type sugar transport system ATPase subunit